MITRRNFLKKATLSLTLTSSFILASCNEEQRRRERKERERRLKEKFDQNNDKTSMSQTTKHNT